MRRGMRVYRTAARDASTGFSVPCLSGLDTQAPLLVSSVDRPKIGYLFESMLRVKVHRCIFGPAVIEPNAFGRLLAKFSINGFAIHEIDAHTVPKHHGHHIWSAIRCGSPGNM